MKIILLGTGTTLPQEKRNASGLLIQVADEFLLFDCGNGILRQIERANVDFTQIKTIFISHQHADHVNDIPILLKADLLREVAPVIEIYGPSTIEGIIQGWFKYIYSYLAEILDLVEIHELKNDWIEGNNWKVQAFPVQHGIEAYGFQIVSEGKKVIYSGDTGVCEALIQAAKDADLLIHECSYPATHKHGKGHTGPVEVGQIAHQANVKQVVLTHFYPVCSGHEAEFLKDVRENYSGKVLIGQDLQEIKLE